MDEPKFPFTPQIFRYLEEIVTFNDNELSNELDGWIVVKSYIAPEKPSVKLALINSSFWSYLQEIGAIELSDDNKIAVGKTINAEIIECSGGGRHIAFTEYKFKVLDIDKINHLLRHRITNSIIKFKTLELIARMIGEFDNGYGLVDLLRNCGVDSELIIYPNTKWRMIYAVFKTLATSPKLEDHQILFRILEEASHPLTHNGNEDSAAVVTERFNNLLKFDGFRIINGSVSNVNEPKEEHRKISDKISEESDSGISSPYENTELELFIMKRIGLEHKRRDDAGFCAKEFSFKKNTLESICRVIERLIEDNIIILSANSKPENDMSPDSKGIYNNDGFIHWDIVKELDAHPELMDDENKIVIFDIEVIDEVKLKGRIDIAIDEFMNDKVYLPVGTMMDKDEVEGLIKYIETERDAKKKEALSDALIPEKTTYSYDIQRAAVIEKVITDKKGIIEVPLNNFEDQRVSIFKTLMALEKENIIRLKALDGLPMFDEKNKNFIGLWSQKDCPTAKIQILQEQKSTREPMHIVIDDIKSDVGIKGLEERVILQKPKNKKIYLRKFPIDLKWEEISMHFLNGQEAIITARGETHQADFIVMGFQDERTKLPNKQWEFLVGLSKTGGKIAWGDRTASDKGKKQKQLLSESLKAYFQINDNPFYDYQREKEYSIKMNLIPEVAVPSDRILPTSKPNTKQEALDIQEAYNEQTPEVYDG